MTILVTGGLLVLAAPFLDARLQVPGPESLPDSLETRQLFDETGDSDFAVAEGLQRTGRIITSAALLIGVAFASFATGAGVEIKTLGVGFALAILLDATIVRTLLVSATMRLMGDWNWWAPGPLRRFHERYGLHEPPSPPAQVDEPSDDGSGDTKSPLPGHRKPAPGVTL